MKIYVPSEICLQLTIALFWVEAWKSPTVSEDVSMCPMHTTVQQLEEWICDTQTTHMN